MCVSVVSLVFMLSFCGLPLHDGDWHKVSVGARGDSEDSIVDEVDRNEPASELLGRAVAGMMSSMKIEMRGCVRAGQIEGRRMGKNRLQEARRANKCK